MVTPGADLAALLLAGIERAGLALSAGDLLCVAQKIVSKAEGRQVNLAGVEPSRDATRLAEETGKDARIVQLILDESTEILRARPGVVIARHRLGLVCANAGIDQSNIDHAGGEQALLLPLDPDASAAGLRAALHARTGVLAGIIITDSHNRPWRLGTVGVAIGSAGLAPLDDHRGGQDLYGRELRVTLINRIDALAAAATLLMGETTEGLPAVLCRGAQQPGNGVAAEAIRPLAEDLFR